jgi:hypothetical protein
MKRIICTLAFILIGFVVLALGVDAIVGISQPALEPGAAEGVLRTFDEDGKLHENRLVVVDDGGTLWIQSGHHFRGWYHRLLRNPEVERAFRFYLIRTLLLFADVKPVRLDARGQVPAADPRLS